MMHHSKYQDSEYGGIRQEDILSFSYIYIGKACHAPRRSCVSTNKNNLKDFDFQSFSFLLPWQPALCLELARFLIAKKKYMSSLSYYVLPHDGEQEKEFII